MSIGWRWPTMLIRFAFICVMSSRTGAVMASMLASSCTSDGKCAPAAAGQRSRSDSDAEAGVPGGTNMAPARCAAAASLLLFTAAPRPWRRKWSGVPRSGAALACRRDAGLALLLRRAAPLQDATRSHGGGALGRRHDMAGHACRAATARGGGGRKRGEGCFFRRASAQQVGPPAKRACGQKSATWNSLLRGTSNVNQPYLLVPKARWPVAMPRRVVPHARGVHAPRRPRACLRTLSRGHQLVLWAHVPKYPVAATYASRGGRAENCCCCSFSQPGAFRSRREVRVGVRAARQTADVAFGTTKRCRRDPPGLCRWWRNRNSNPLHAAVRPPCGGVRSRRAAAAATAATMGVVRPRLRARAHARAARRRHQKQTNACGRRMRAPGTAPRRQAAARGARRAAAPFLAPRSACTHRPAAQACAARFPFASANPKMLTDRRHASANRAAAEDEVEPAGGGGAHQRREEVRVPARVAPPPGSLCRARAPRALLHAC
jgi:hypothetical protein